MKILLVGEYFPGTCAYYYEKVLKKKHRVKIYDYRRSFLKIKSRTLLSRGIRHFFPGQYAEIMNRHLLKAFDMVKPDMVFVVKGENISPETIRQIKKRCKIVCWWVDPVISFQKKEIFEIAGEYDLFFTKDKAVLNLMRLSGKDNCRYLPEGFDETVYFKDKYDNDYASDISIVGFQYYFRLLTLSKLSGYDLKLWGKIAGDLSQFRGLKYNDRFISVEEKNKVFNSTKINLNLHHPGEIDSANVRLFEICGAGGFQIVDYKPCIEEFFEIDKEIVCFRDLDELKKKIKYYLKHDKERKKIAEAGHKRALDDHKISKRIQYLMKQVNKF